MLIRREKQCIVKNVSSKGVLTLRIMHYRDVEDNIHMSSFALTIFGIALPAV
jgi:hypothetical protein